MVFDTACDELLALELPGLMQVLGELYFTGIPHSSGIRASWTLVPYKMARKNKARNSFKSFLCY